MIDSVRNMVHALLNKHNYGYVPVSDFNLYAKYSQLDIFNDMFSQYNEIITKENLRRSGTGDADTLRLISEGIERFREVKDLTHVTANQFYLPSLTTTGDEAKRIDSFWCYDTSKSPREFVAETEVISRHELAMVLSSHLTPPTQIFPAHVLKGDSVLVYPTTFSSQKAVEAHYIRYPKVPKWTWITLLNGEPVFDQSQSDYQDFELDAGDEIMLIIKICQYAGIEIREEEVYAAMKGAEMKKEPKQQTQ